MPISLEHIFDELETKFSMGDWFLINNRNIIKRTKKKQQFSKKTGSHPVIVAEGDIDSEGLRDFRPIRVIYPRSTSDYPHPRRIPPKSHNDYHCNITEDGWVCLHIPCTVKRELLNMNTYSCSEPEDSDLMKSVRVEQR